jgi:hypothetical protein
MSRGTTVQPPPTSGTETEAQKRRGEDQTTGKKQSKPNQQQASKQALPKRSKPQADRAQAWHRGSSRTLAQKTASQPSRSPYRPTTPQAHRHTPQAQPEATPAGARGARHKKPQRGPSPVRNPTTTATTTTTATASSANQHDRGPLSLHKRSPNQNQSTTNTPQPPPPPQPSLGR